MGNKRCRRAPSVDLGDPDVLSVISSHLRRRSLIVHTCALDVHTSLRIGRAGPVLRALPACDSGQASITGEAEINATRVDFEDPGPEVPTITLESVAEFKVPTIDGEDSYNFRFAVLPGGPALTEVDVPDGYPAPITEVDSCPLETHLRLADNGPDHTACKQ